jgi:anti-sigma factor RsiW
MWTCETVALELPAYVHGNLATETAAPVERHLRGCLTCQKEFRQLEKLERILTQHFLEEQLPAIKPSPTFASSFANRLAAEMAAEEAAKSRWDIAGWFSRPWLIPVAAAAALAAIVIGTVPGTGTPVAEAPEASKPVVARQAPAAESKAPVAMAQPLVKPETGTASLPKELAERPDLFVDYSVIDQLEMLDHAESAG